MSMARVLLADDDANARSLMARALASDGVDGVVDGRGVGEPLRAEQGLPSRHVRPGEPR